MEAPAQHAPATARSLESGELTYRADVDGLRAVAVLTVITFHAATRTLPGGFVGVDVFFVISGFLITSIIIRGLDRGTFSLVGFYARRVRRIFPALIAVLAVTSVLFWLVQLPDEYGPSGWQSAASAAFVLNLQLYKASFRYFEQESFLLHLWSLGVEEQFYLFWPIFLLIVWKIRLRLTLLIAVTILSFGLNVSWVESNPHAAFYLPMSRLWELSAGGLLAYQQSRTHFDPGASITRESNHTHAVLRHLYGLVGLALLVFSFTCLDEDIAFPGWWAIFPVSGTLLLLSAGCHSWVNRHLLSTPVVVAIGRISYPLYLWHWPLLKMSHLVGGVDAMVSSSIVAVILSFILAALTYRYIEMPIRHAGITPWRISGLCAGLAICGIAGYASAIGAIPSRSLDDRVERFYRVSTEKFPPATGWHGMFVPLGTGSRSAVFIGDSNVIQYYSRMKQITSDHPAESRRVVFATMGNCAPGAIEIAKRSKEFVIACKAFLRKAFDLARGDDVDVVVIGGAWYGYFVPWLDHDHYGESAPLLPETDRALKELQHEVAALVGAGKPVYVILQVPVGVRTDPRRMIRRTMFPPGFEIKVSHLSRAEVDAAVDAIDQRLRGLARATGAYTIDPRESLCGPSACAVVTANGEPMYNDIAHLRPEYLRTHVHFLDHIVLGVDLSQSTADPIQRSN